MIDIVQTAFKEDLPHGDITTQSMGITNVPGQAKLVAKQDLVLSGQEIFEKSILYMEPMAQFNWQFKDGEKVLKGQVIALINGNLIDLLKAERVALNFLGHLSGIATLTRKFVDKIKYSDTKILDTRKTTPILRELEKKAVKDGGGTNHRMNLSDAVLIKDNHITALGGISNAINIIKKNALRPIEVECQTLEDVEIAIGKDVQQILLDNMDTETIRKAVRMIPQHIKIEASGNMTLDRVQEVADTGVHYISVGALTHSAPCADISMKFDWNKK